MKFTTLCYIEQDDKYLMLFRNKKIKDFNKGKWIGVGGNPLEQETPEACLLREVKEETGFTLLNFQLRSEIIFDFDHIEEKIYLYTSTEFTGNLIDCDEGELRWISKQAILSLPLWEGDKIFLTKIMSGDPFFKLTLYYENNLLQSYEIEE